MFSQFMPLPLQIPWWLQAHGVLFMAIGLHLLYGFPRSGNNPALGVASFAVGLGYLATAYVPAEQNAWLYASAPARLLVGALLGLRLAVDRGELPPQERRAVLVLGLYDALGGAATGLYLGTFSGRIPAYQ